MTTLVAVAILLQAPQDAKIEWRMDKGKELALMVSYSEKHETTKGDKTETTSDVREVKGKACATAGVIGYGLIDLTLTDIAWTMSDGAYEAKVTKTSKGVKPESTGGEKGQDVLKRMQQAVAAEYKMRPSSNEVPMFGIIQQGAFNGGREVDALFRNVFVMSLWTADLRENVAWDVKLTDIPVAKDAGVAELKMKINYKGGDKFGAVGEARTKWKSEDGAAAGLIFVRRKMEWNRKGWLGVAEEEVKFTREKADEKYSLTIVSKLTLK